MPDETTRPTDETAHPAAGLRAIRVDYPDRPDRCTICPRNVDDPTLMATWLTADADAFVDLDAVR